MLRRVTRHPAFSLVEVLVALALVAILAALVIPTAKSQLDKSEVSAATSNLQSIREAILAYRENVGFYPIELLQLSNKPGISGASSNNSCGAALSAASIAKWRGPYLAQAVTTGGIASGDVTIQNTLVRSPANTSSVPEGTLIVQVANAPNSASETFVLDVEQMFDPGTSDLNAGAIRWTVTSGIIGTMTFHIGIRGC